MKKFMKKSLIYLIPAILVTAVFIVLDLYVSLNMGQIIDAAMAKDKVLFINEIKVTLVLTITLFILDLVSTSLYNLYRNKAVVNLKIGYINELFGKSISQINTESSSGYISSITNDINMIEKDYVKGLYDIITSLVRLVLTIMLIISISREIFYFMIILGVITTVISMTASIPIKKYNKKKSEGNESLVAYTREILNTFHVIKLNNLTEKVKEKYKLRVSRVEHDTSRISKILALSSSLQTLTSNLVLIGTFAILVYFILKDKASVGSVYIIAKNVQYVMGPIMAMMELMPNLLSTKTIFKRLEDSCKNHVGDKETIEMANFHKSIKVNNISFAYGDKEVFNNLDLLFERNRKYLIAGPSGCGKSTMLNMLKKLLYPQRGNIEIDDVPLKRITAESYFRNIAAIEQQIFLFEDTLKNNITLYKEYLDEDINRAIEMAGLREFVEALPKKLDTIILDNGKNISGGEKSRIAIARSLIMNCRVLLLDEAFASLDYDTARDIESTILSIPEITLINVTHVVFEMNKPLYDDIYVLKSPVVLQ